MGRREIRKIILACFAHDSEKKGGTQWEGVGQGVGVL